MDKILQTGDYTPEQKEKCFKIKNKCHLLACCDRYFSLLYLCENGNGQIQYSWIIWAIAGVLYGVVMIIIDLISRRIKMQIVGYMILLVFYLVIL
ncbi:MAG: hypothetical protein ACLR43_08670 [Faecalibacillus faecis]